jgi:hypothetical protein
VRILKNPWFVRFARKERIADSALIEAIGRAKLGLIDADLGGGVIKQRVARRGQGKSGGYRALILYRAGDRAVFAFGFAKNDLDNIDDEDLGRLRDAAKLTLGFSDDELTRLVEAGKLTEIDNDG